ncbi:MAG: hypothetical protein GX986_00890 [Firmicutes bacterium]|nr:hypothetical protein [Bacillota bacterium]
MGKRKRRKKTTGSLDRIASDALEALEKVKVIVDIAGGITTSLNALLGNYRVMQSDGSLDMLLSALKAKDSQDESSEE